MSESNDLPFPLLLPATSTNSAAPYHPFPLYYTLLPQHDALRSLPAALALPRQPAERHVTNRQSEPSLSRGGPPPLLSLPANPLFFGKVLAAATTATAMPSQIPPQCYCFPVSGLSYAVVSDVVSADGLRRTPVRGENYEKEGPSEKLERMLESGASELSAFSVAEPRLLHANSPALADNGAWPFENMRDMSPVTQAAASSNGAASLSGADVGIMMASRAVDTSAAANKVGRSVRRRADTSTCSSVSLEGLLKNQVTKTTAGDCDTSSLSEQPQLHAFHKLFVNSGASDALRIRNLATDESGIVTWLEITRRASHIDPSFGPVDAVRILVSSNGLCKLQLTYPFMRTVRTRLIPNTQEDADELLCDLGPNKVLCPGIQDYECRFSRAFSRVPAHVRAVDTLQGAKRYEHDHCLVWHAPAHSFSVPGQVLHNVCRNCRQMDGILLKRLASRGHVTDPHHNREATWRSDEEATGAQQAGAGEMRNNENGFCDDHDGHEVTLCESV